MHAGAERGSATVELTLLTPLLVLLVSLLVQAALTYHAHNTLQAAAQEGTRTARAYRSTAAAGRQEALDYLNAVAPRLVSDPQASATRTAGRARVTVSGSVTGPIPFWRVRLTATAESPVERFTP